MRNPWRKPYDYDETMGFLQRAVAEKGDGHTTESAYVDCITGAPICIVGHVLNYMGLLKRVQGNGVGVRHLGLAGRHLITFEALDALAEAQEIQDTGATWGEALIAAK